jgi:hypothetical protein
MVNRNLLAGFLAAALALPAVSMSGEEPITKSESVQARATVVAVDQATRMVTPKGETPQGVSGTAKRTTGGGEVGRQVTYTESLAIRPEKVASK